MIKHGAWRKSSYSVGESNCVEIADMADGRTAIRDTQNRHLGHLTVPATEWAALLADVRNDRL